MKKKDKAMEIKHIKNESNRKCLIYWRHEQRPKGISLGKKAYFS